MHLLPVFRPHHTLESVAGVLERGLRNGTVLLRPPMEPPEVAVVPSDAPLPAEWISEITGLDDASSGVLRDKPGRVEDTVRMLLSVTSRSSTLAASILAGRTAWPELDDVALLSRGYEWIRLALKRHLDAGEIDLGDYHYLISVSFVGEAPLLIAGATARFAATRISGHPTEALSSKEWLSVNEILARARRHVFQSRAQASQLRWALRLLRVAWAARGARPAGAEHSDSREWRPTTARAQRVPLGFGDLKFKLASTSAAVRHLYYLGRMIVAPDAAAADLLADHRRSLAEIEEYLLRLNRGAALPEAPHALPIASGVALVKAEATVSRYRLSKDSMLVRSKIYLLRASGYLSHWSTARQSAPSPAPDQLIDQMWALQMARACFIKAQDLLRQSRSLWRHDLAWSILGADLRVDLGPFSVLRQYTAGDVATLLDTVEERIELSETGLQPVTGQMDRGLGYGFGFLSPRHDAV